MHSLDCSDVLIVSLLLGHLENNPFSFTHLVNVSVVLNVNSNLDLVMCELEDFR